ncbi:MAG: S24 family peptidase [Sphaerochaeta sp.]|nr:S24 family peptidase [Sphaerochaeta sp.]
MLLIMNGNRFWESVKSYLVEDLNQQWLCRVVGIPSNSLSMMIARGTMPKADIAMKISDAIGVPLEDLLGMNGQRKVRKTTIFPENEVNDESREEPTFLVPMAPQKVSAGNGEHYLEGAEDLGYVRVVERMARGLDKSTLVAAMVKGDSMTGIQMFEDDIVIFAKGHISSNGIYVVALAGEVLVKRVEFNPLTKAVAIISENPRYSTISTTSDDPNFRIWGKVVGWIHVHPY